MRRLTETERAIEISIVCGIWGEGAWEDDWEWVDKNGVSVPGGRESTEEEEWRRGVPPVVVAWLVSVGEDFLETFRGKGIVWERTS